MYVHTYVYVLSTYLRNNMHIYIESRREMILPIFYLPIANFDAYIYIRCLYAKKRFSMNA